ncbi:hypothetical protein [Clostridium sp. JN-1]|uniref:hypothetical protein n=1 Tax=Clostridium sp. JN-1 TaxID=2483110 RepID=UPI000F0AFEB4|nr:hypothetical protein [Clostridium sp. JN-1]
MKICKNKVLKAIRAGKIDAANISFPNLINTIILKMKNAGLINKLSKNLKDKRKQNKHIPFDILIALVITAKMKLKTSLTNVTFAVTDSELLSEFGWNMLDTDRNLKKGLFAEGIMRNLITQYNLQENMYFQLFKNMEEGRNFSGKSLPVVLKNYKEDKQKSVIIYPDQYFGVFSFIEFIHLYAGCFAEVRRLLDPTLALV